MWLNILHWQWHGHESMMPKSFLHSTIPVYTPANVLVWPIYQGHVDVIWLDGPILQNMMLLQFFPLHWNFHLVSFCSFLSVRFCQSFVTPFACLVLFYTFLHFLLPLDNSLCIPKHFTGFKSSWFFNFRFFGSPSTSITYIYLFFYQLTCCGLLIGWMTSIHDLVVLQMLYLYLTRLPTGIYNNF